MTRRGHEGGKNTKKKKKSQTTLKEVRESAADKKYLVQRESKERDRRSTFPATVSVHSGPLNNNPILGLY
jgi:hypothetical protein